MTETETSSPAEDVDVLRCSPDGEPRNVLYRTGDIYPMDPAPHHRSGISEPATDARPWGMRHLRVPGAVVTLVHPD